MTHWQHPRFFAYFPANAAPVSVVAEYLVSAMAAQCMLWQTSPAATELETKVVDWLRQALGLPDGLSGRHPGFRLVGDAFGGADHARARAGLARQPERPERQPRLRVYCSDQVHTSIDRAIWVSGIGEENLVRIAGRRSLALDESGGAGSRYRGRPRKRSAAGRHHRLRRRNQHRRHRRHSGGERGRPQTRPLSACRRRMGGLGDDLPRVSAILGWRGRCGFGRLQPAQMAWRPVRLLGAVHPRAGAAWCGRWP